MALTMSIRGAVKPPNGAYNLRSLMELNVLQGIGAIANKPKWWMKWRDEEIRGKWLQEIEREFVSRTLQQTLLEWPTLYELEEFFLEGLKPAFEASDATERARLLAEKRSNVALDVPKGDGEDEEENDDGDEETADEGDDVSNSVLVSKNLNRESYGQIAFYFLQVTLWETASSLPEELWTRVSDPANPVRYGAPSTDAVMQLVALVHTKHTSANVERTTSFLVDLLAQDTLDLDTIQGVLGRHETRQEAHQFILAHCNRIRDEIMSVRSYITQMLDLYVDKFNLGDDESSISPGPVQETWLCDDLVDTKLRNKFISEVKVLEDVPEDKKDWHPNTNQQVLDLVHPSLYCCVFGKTSGLVSRPSVDDMSSSKLFMPGAEAVVQNPCSSSPVRFQWIPSEFSIDDERDKVKILSYINNLHPGDFSSLYDSISSIFGRFVPLFDRVLSNLATKCPIERFDLPSMEGRATQYLPQRPTIPDHVEVEDAPTTVSIKGKIVQVIVKIAEIQLTPENPKYNGGSWHVEGTDAEQIVATGLYYFGCENITESRLSFRVVVGEPDYEQSDYAGMAALYGLRNEERLVQYLGSVTAQNGRGVVFPNTLEHKVEPFELVDPTKPGTRKILAFFLVDPTKTIPSSAVIRAQQQDWIERAQAPVLKKMKLPECVESKVGRFAGAGMTLAEALAYRLELMTERSPIVDDGGDPELYFSLCEH